MTPSGTRLGAGVPYARIIAELGDRLPGAGDGLAHGRLAADPQPWHGRRQPRRLLPRRRHAPGAAGDRRRVEVASVRGTREIPIGEFYRGVKRNALAPDELITAVQLPAARRAAAVQQGRHAQRDGDRGLLLRAGPAPRRARSARASGRPRPTPIRAVEAERFAAEELPWESPKPLTDCGGAALRRAGGRRGHADRRRARHRRLPPARAVRAGPPHAHLGMEGLPDEGARCA